MELVGHLTGMGVLLAGQHRISVTYEITVRRGDNNACSASGSIDGVKMEVLEDASHETPLRLMLSTGSEVKVTVTRLSPAWAEIQVLDRIPGF